MTVRPANPDDADELVRLRAVMLRDLSPHDWNDEWREPARRSLAARLAEAEPTLAGFVIDRPDGTGLASCALGTVEQRLGSPGNPTGRCGYVFSVVTDTDLRRRGYSRACVVALLDWYRGRGITRIDLKASPEGEGLYRRLGFVRTPDPAMRLSY